MSAALLSAKIAIVEEEPRVRAIQAAPTAVTGAVGICERGPIGVPTLVTSFEEYVRIFGGYAANADMPLAAQGFFENGGQQLYVVRTVHYADNTNAGSKTSAAGSVTIPTSNLAATSGFTEGTVIGPWELTAGDHIDIVVDIAGVLQPAVQVSFLATAASRETSNNQPFVLANLQTLTVKIDRGSVQTIEFLSGEFANIATATADEVADVINAKIVGAKAIVTNTTRVTIVSDKEGLDSYVEVTGGTANAGLAFNTAEVQGTGNVDDIKQVTFTEFKTIVEAAVSSVLVTNVANLPRITRTTTGTNSKVQVASSSTCEQVFGFDTAVHAGSNSGTLSTLTVTGKTDGSFANAIKPVIAAASNGVASNFNFSLVKNGVAVEVWPNVSMDDTATNFIETVVNDPKTGSNLVTVTDLDAATASPNDRPANGTYTMTGGSDGLASLDDNDFIGSSVGHTGIRALDTVDTLRLLIVPGRATAAVQNAQITYCEIARNMTVFTILSSPAGLDAASVVTYVKSTALLQQSSEFAAFYWPQIQITNPAKSVYGSSVARLTVDPVGHIAGLYARNDNAKPGGVYEAPAGIEFGKLAGVVGLETDEVKDEVKRDLVFPELINPIVILPGSPIHIDGARTLKSTSNFPTVGERRGVIFIETSLQNGLLFAKHRKIKPSLLAQLDRAVRAFLVVQMRNDAFASDDPKKAFFVDFSKALNPASEGFIRKVNGRIGLATAKPAEFIVLRISQDQRALEEELAQAA